MLTNRPINRVSLAVALAAGSLASAAGAAIDFRQALDIATAAVSNGTPIEIERTSFNGVDAIEVEFAFAGGAWLREVTLAAASGSILEIDTYTAGPVEAAEISGMLPLIVSSSIDLPEAGNLASGAFAGSGVLRTDYAIENGRLIIEALLTLEGATFEVDVDANTGAVTGGPNPGGGDVPPTPGDNVMSLAIATASAARPNLTAVEIAREFEEGTPVWAVKMLNPATVRVTEVLVRASGTGVVEIENDSLSGSDLVEMQNLSALFPLDLTLDEALAATRNRFADVEILAVEFEAQGGSLRIEALVRENGASRWVEFNPADQGGGAEPGPDAGFAAIADAAIAERPDLILIEVERAGMSKYEATLVSATLGEVVELEIARDGTVLESDPISLGGDAGEIAQILSLIGPGTAAFADASNAFSAVYPAGDIREIEFDIRRGELVYEATVLIGGSLVEVFIPSDAITTPPQATINACPADLTLDAQIDFFDAAAFLDAFSNLAPIGDWNGDASFDFGDIQAFLQDLSNGCP